MKFIINVVLIIPVILFAQDLKLSEEITAKLPYAKSLLNVTVSYGNTDAIEVKWERAGEKYSYLVTRSMKKNEPVFEPLAVTDKLTYMDSAAEPGIKYWYRIYPLTSDGPKQALASDAADGILINTDDYQKSAEKSLGKLLNATPDEETPNNTDAVPEVKYNYSGYRKLPMPAGEEIEKLMREKNERPPRIKDKDEQLEVSKRLDYIKPYYMNPAKFNLTLFMAKPYLQKGELKIFSSFETLFSSEGDRTVTYIGKKYSYMVSFYSKKLFSIMNGSDDPGLNEILLGNAEVYCTYSGEKEYLDENGLTHVLPFFDAVALSTRYYKNDREWKNNSIMLATSRKDLMERVKKAANAQANQNGSDSKDSKNMKDSKDSIDSKDVKDVKDSVDSKDANTEKLEMGDE